MGTSFVGGVEGSDFGFAGFGLRDLIRGLGLRGHIRGWGLREAIRGLGF